MIEGVDFFNLWRTVGDTRFGSLACGLKRALKEKSREHTFLIVLPEAFNLGADYNGGIKTPRIPAERALRWLAHLSRKHRVAFVAGLLHAVERFNSAYLIDSDPGARPWALAVSQTLRRSSRRLYKAV